MLAVHGTFVPLFRNRGRTSRLLVADTRALCEPNPSIYRCSQVPMLKIYEPMSRFGCSASNAVATSESALLSLRIIEVLGERSVEQRNGVLSVHSASVSCWHILPPLTWPASRTYGMPPRYMLRSVVVSVRAGTWMISCATDHSEPLRNGIGGWSRGCPKRQACSGVTKARTQWQTVSPVILDRTVYRGHGAVERTDRISLVKTGINWVLLKPDKPERLELLAQWSHRMLDALAVIE